jgi:hypothetical protein
MGRKSVVLGGGLTSAPLYRNLESATTRGDYLAMSRSKGRKQNEWCALIDDER